MHGSPPVGRLVSYLAHVRRTRVSGKAAPRTDTYHGYFARLVPNEQVVEVLDLETEDPELRGEMTRATILTQVEGGTHVLVVQETCRAIAGWRFRKGPIATNGSGLSPPAAVDKTAVWRASTSALPRRALKKSGSVRRV